MSENLITWIKHGRIDLALHLLRQGSKTPAPKPVLLLAGLGEPSISVVPDFLTSYQGPVFALDLTGHGRSTIPPGGGYTAEVLMADVFVALKHIGSAHVIGRGVGGYLGLLVAGAAPHLVSTVVICDGPGLNGGGVAPASPFASAQLRSGHETPDPFALFELNFDVRPPDYACRYVRMAAIKSDSGEPILVAAKNRPEWLEAVTNEPGVQICTLDQVVEKLAG